MPSHLQGEMASAPRLASLLGLLLTLPLGPHGLRPQALRMSARERASPTRLRRNALNRAAIPPPFPTRVAVLGGGSFGLAMASVVGRKDIPTTVLMRGEEDVEYFNKHKEHPRYLQGIKMPNAVRATADPAAALRDATYVIHAVPVQHSRKFLTEVEHLMPPGAPVLSTSKGIETSTLQLMTDILHDTLGPHRSTAYLSGPSFAAEIAQGLATAVTIASSDPILADDFAAIVSSDSFRAYTTPDVVGVEVGGAVKNVIALAAGMSEGLGLGTNAMAGLVTRGCWEMRRVAMALGAQPSTLMGLSGVGDTFGTCFGPLSRNRGLGVRLGRGEKLDDALKCMGGVAEGVPTAFALRDLVKRVDNSYRLDLKFPIIFGVSDILEGKLEPREGLQNLMMMPIRAEMIDALH
uniref:Glycerol-3-phosphate dehydrogenase [NAD(+)] n=1 Tax=Pinguiococcus pyrenoidosus TaxID=172671 RepID=A0A7R9YBR2_9STRA